MIEVLQPKTREEWLALRSPFVGASEAPALLGAHPFMTGYALWALKSGAVPGDKSESQPMKRGRLLERVAVDLIGEDHPTWRLESNAMPGGKIYRDPALRLSCTPDLFAIDPERPGFGCVQIKSVEVSQYAKKWHDENREISPPLYAAVQAIIEAKLTGAAWCAVAPLVIGFGIDVPVIDVPLHGGVFARVQSEVAAFWRMIDEGRKPYPDYARDSTLIEDLYAPTGEIVDLSKANELPVLADERAALSAAKSTAEKRLKEIKAEILVKLDGASAARIADGRLITAKRIERAGYSVNPTSWIDVRIKRASGQGAEAND